MEPFIYVSPISLFFKLIRANMIAMILWFLNIRHLGTLFGMCQNMIAILLWFQIGRWK
jgi:hypothetical protein